MGNRLEFDKCPGGATPNTDLLSEPSRARRRTVTLQRELSYPKPNTTLPGCPQGHFTSGTVHHQHTTILPPPSLGDDDDHDDLEDDDLDSACNTR